MLLIDAKALYEKIKEHHDLYVNAWGSFKNLPANDKARVDAYTSCIAELMNAPTIDAVPVVRCKDCAKRGGYNCPMFFEEQTFSEDDGYDWIDHDSTTDEGFCQCGVRLEDWIDEPD